jgi:phthalate 3,4-dioxygenase ferredoxin reductase component
VTEAPDRVVVVGASVAGVAVVRALRAEGFEREVVLLGNEEDWPYDKPPLSKEVLCADPAMVRTSLLTPEQAAELSIDVRLGVAAVELDVAAREVVLADGSRLGYGACVVATGASPRPSPWALRPGVHELRTMRDSTAIREGFDARGPVAVVGGGFIGAEVASSARMLGLDVTVLDPLAAPMERLVGIDAARLFTDLAARHGVDLRLGHGVHAIDGEAGALTITLSDGSTVAAATAVIGIGVLPNDGWLASSGLLLDNGVVCDEHCRAVGAEDVYAAGDVARWHHPEQAEPVRVEHWTNAVDQAGTVAHNIAHPDESKPYAPVPYVWTDQYGWKFQIAGHPERAARHEVLGDLGGERPRAALVYEDPAGRLIGALTVNWPRALVALRRAIGDGLGAAEAARALGDGAAKAATT